MASPSTGGRPRAGWRGFGVAGALPAELIRELAPAAEAAGYHTFWVNDTPHGDGLAALRAAADVTATVQLGVGVIPLDRQPAEDIARRVVDLGLPQERLLVGVGSGRQHGGLARVRDGARLLTEQLAAVIVIGALGPKMCALAGQRADGVLLNWLTAEYVAPSAAIVDQAAAEAGAAPAPHPRVRAHRLWPGSRRSPGTGGEPLRQRSGLCGELRAHGLAG